MDRLQDPHRAVSIPNFGQAVTLGDDAQGNARFGRELIPLGRRREADFKKIVELYTPIKRWRTSNRNRHGKNIYPLRTRSKKARQMESACNLKWVAMAAISLTLTASLIAHPGPEPHPTVPELEEVVAELREEISELESQMNSKIDSLESLLSGIDENAIANAVQGKVDEVLEDTVHSLRELNDRFDQIGESSTLPDWMVIVALIGGVFGGVFAAVELVLRMLKLRRSSQSKQASESNESAGDSCEKDEQEDEEESNLRRIVTATTKEPSTGNVVALHNSNAEWSPRRIEDAIVDIENRGVEYISRGPMGNEAKIEIKHPIRGKPYLTTKPDKHGGNNLRELPDPS